MAATAPLELSHPESGGPPDTELFIRQAFELDPQRGYELLFRAYYRDLCSTVVRFVYSRQTAEDIVGELFLAFCSHHTYKTITTSYRAYLFRAARNRALNHLRYEFGQLSSLDELTGETEPNTYQQPDEILLLDDLQRRINDTVRQLPPQAQRVFIMSRFDGKAHADIAAELHINPKTVEGHVTRALSSLRQLLRHEFLPVLLTGWFFFA